MKIKVIITDSVVEIFEDVEVRESISGVLIVSKSDKTVASFQRWQYWRVIDDGL